jgi:hypothetical protein
MKTSRRSLFSLLLAPFAARLLPKKPCHPQCAPNFVSYAQPVGSSEFWKYEAGRWMRYVP